MLFSRILRRWRNRWRWLLTTKQACRFGVLRELELEGFDVFSVFRFLVMPNMNNYFHSENGTEKEKMIARWLLRIVDQVALFPTIAKPPK